MAASSKSQYEDKTVAELHEELSARDLPTSGNKAELVDRLAADDKENSKSSSKKDEPVSKAKKGDGFGDDEGVTLDPDADPLEESEKLEKDKDHEYDPNVDPLVPSSAVADEIRKELSIKDFKGSPTLDALREGAKADQKK